MSNPYTPPTLQNYNADPPPDDGSETVANEITWNSKIKAKIGDPLKDFSESINSAISSAFDSNYLNSTNAQTNTYIVQLSDRGKLITASGTFPIDLPAAETAGDGFEVTVKNISTGVITVAADVPETIDGQATFVISGINRNMTFMSDGSNWNTVGPTNVQTQGAVLDDLNTTGQNTIDGEMLVGTGPGALAWESGSTLKQSIGGTIQSVQAQTGAVATGTTIIPGDDSIPQNTEGTEFLTQAITPTNTNNKLLIEVTATLAHTAVSTVAIVSALFQDSTADALAASIATHSSTASPSTVVLRHEMTAGTISETTFKVRIGSDTAGTVTFNGSASARLLGGVMASSIRVTEFTP